MALSCDDIGNLASASVPATIALNGLLGKILFTGFGGGLSVSIGRLELDAGCRLSQIEA